MESCRPPKAAVQVRILAGVLADPVAQRRRRLPDTEEFGGSSPPGITAAGGPAALDAVRGVAVSTRPCEGRSGGFTPPRIAGAGPPISSVSGRRRRRWATG